MSLAHLLIAARNQLQTSFSIDSKVCDVEEGPQPPPKCGQIYYSIYGTEWTPGPNPNQHQGIDEHYGFAVCITKRAGYVPKHRLGDVIYTHPTTGILAIARSVIIALVPNRYAVLTAANTLIGITNAIQEPYQWIGCDPAPIQVGPDWFGASPQTSNTPTNVVNLGYRLEVRFGNARRLQTYVSMT